MSGESDAIADMIAQMRQLAEEHPEAAQRLAAELTAAIWGAGMAFDGGQVQKRAPAAPANETGEQAIDAREPDEASVKQEN